MPARTNEFQKLVKLINQGLASTDAKVTESAMLFDHVSQKNREIDILIESIQVNSVIRIGIECTATKNPVDVNRLESIKEKHRNVGVNMTIIVSKNGFSSTAKTYAEMNHMKLLTFNSARNEDWSKNLERFKGLSVYNRTYQLRSISAKLTENDVTVGFTFDPNVTVNDGEHWVSISQFASNLFTASGASERYFKEMMENERFSPDPVVNIGFALGGRHEMKDVRGNTVTPLEISCQFAYRSRYTNLDSRQVAYDGEPFVVGGFTGTGKSDFAHVALREKDSQLTGTIELGAQFLSTFDQTSKNDRTP